METRQTVQVKDEKGPRFNSILVANRGEIALRILRTAKGLGFRTVAVYSKVDAGLLHVSAADRAVCLGEAAAKESYLNIPRVIAAALRSGAEAVHPGYGFLAESPEFAEACRDANLVFIGPTPEAIRDMGNKSIAKRLMQESGVSCIPGYDGADQTEGVMRCEADRIGYPVMVKAMAGGGGKGMRLVESAAQLTEALRGAGSEAEKSFGDGRLMLEKAIVSARHIEVQIFGDQLGNIVYLGDRDCSLQRRHQKIIEEAPAPGLSAELRRRLGEAAVQAARAVNYYGAGTVEFLLAPNNEFYFLEMNTRLQVEHPVTEMVTGQDLVEWQLKVAQGQPLPLKQGDIQLSGHAFEARVYAEDPAARFLPQSGRLSIWQPPVNDGIRVDHALCQGLEVSTYYDPMLAKVISFGPDREVARFRLRRAIEDFAIGGLRTNLPFLKQCVVHAEFIEGGFDTGFLDRHTFDHQESRTPDRSLIAVAAALHYGRRQQQHGQTLQGWHSRFPITQKLDLGAGDWKGSITVTPEADALNRLHVRDDAGEQVVVMDAGTGVSRMEVDGIQQTVSWAWVDDTLHLVRDELYFQFSSWTADVNDTSAGEGAVNLKAPMPASVVEVRVAAGEEVEAGQVVLVLEAMKMELEISTPVAGLVSQLNVSAGTQVSMEQSLLTLTVESQDVAAT